MKRIWVMALIVGMSGPVSAETGGDAVVAFTDTAADVSLCTDVAGAAVTAANACDVDNIDDLLCPWSVAVKSLTSSTDAAHLRIWHLGDSIVTVTTSNSRHQLEADEEMDYPSYNDRAPLCAVSIIADDTTGGTVQIGTSRPIPPDAFGPLLIF